MLPATVSFCVLLLMSSRITSGSPTDSPDTQPQPLVEPQVYQRRDVPQVVMRQISAEIKHYLGGHPVVCKGREQSSSQLRSPTPSDCGTSPEELSRALETMAGEFVSHGSLPPERITRCFQEFCQNIPQLSSSQNSFFHSSICRLGALFGWIWTNILSEFIEEEKRRAKDVDELAKKRAAGQ